jgi:hypothetical protein
MIEQSGGAAKAARSGGDTGGVGMVFAVHPKFNVLKRILRSAPIFLAYDPLRRCFSQPLQRLIQHHPNHSIHPMNCGQDRRTRRSVG